MQLLASDSMSWHCVLGDKFGELISIDLHSAQNTACKIMSHL